MARLLGSAHGVPVLGEVGNAAHMISHEALEGTRKRRSRLGKKSLWTFVDFLEGPVFSLGSAGVKGPRRHTTDL